MIFNQINRIFIILKFIKSENAVYGKIQTYKPPVNIEKSLHHYKYDTHITNRIIPFHLCALRNVKVRLSYLSTCLTPNDINERFRLRNQQCIYSFRLIYSERK